MNWQNTVNKAWSSARVRQWVCAAVVSRRNIRVNSDDTMTQLRGAWQMFELIRQYYPLKARELRRQYGYSRFYDLYLQWRKFEMSPDECIDHITSELSNAGMTMQIVNVHDPRPEWMRHTIGAYKTICKIITDLDTDPEIIEWARAGVEIMDRKGIGR